MLETADLTTLVRNFGIYAIGVGAAVAGALGLAAAIELSLFPSILLFVGGIAAVLVVHEYLDGPI